MPVLPPRRRSFHLPPRTTPCAAACPRGREPRSRDSGRSGCLEGRGRLPRGPSCRWSPRARVWRRPSPQDFLLLLRGAGYRCWKAPGRDTPEPGSSRRAAPGDGAPQEPRAGSPGLWPPSPQVARPGPAALGAVAQHGGDPSPSALPAGGICWLQQGKEAKCTMILKTGVTWEECCANGNVDVAWSNYTYPGNKISLLGFLGLVTCHPCKESCEGVVCGPDKVCKMKHGRPQCACAPDCSSLPRKLQVCGSDGYTYRDECDLLTAKCRDHPDLEVMYQGKCKSRSGRAPILPRPCPLCLSCSDRSELRPETWGKKCELRAGSCRRQIFQSVRERGSAAGPAVPPLPPRGCAESGGLRGC
uniref:Follistatin like 3 n=1 Tax=Otus sunia TaxID=257818 RepID=A0A8C8B2E4_9STRI